MDLKIVLLICFFSIFIFIVHSYFSRGFRLTFNFFFFAFLVAIIKEGPMMINGILVKNPTMPYEFLTKNTSVMIETMLAIVGWVFTIYLGWYIANRIAQRLGVWENRIFPVVFISGLVTASVGYAVEATAIGIGWWQWTIEDIRLAGFLAGGVPLIVFETWTHFPTQYLLMPYSIIECSRFKRASWKGIFFLIPFVHSVSTQFRPELIRTSIEHIALIILFILAVISPLRFEYSGVRRPSLRWNLNLKLLESLPMLIIMMLVLILVFLDLIKIHNAQLLISLLPVIFFILLAIKRIPLLWIVFFALLCPLILNRQALVAVVPVTVILGFKILARIKAG
jgi:hypothetical protein